MVLKVVRGKILETLRLSWRPSACSFALETADGTGAGAIVRLSNIVDYLLDNSSVTMLSPIKEWVKQRVAGLTFRSPIWEQATGFDLILTAKLCLCPGLLFFATSGQSHQDRLRDTSRPTSAPLVGRATLQFSKNQYIWRPVPSMVSVSNYQ
jgi:hypothetical protein